MSGARFEQIRQLVLQAIELPATERRTFLNESCPDDPELIAEVLSLLEHDNTKQPLLRTGGALAGIDSFVTGVPGGDGSPGCDVPGGRFRHYRLLELIGQGSMGRIYLAEDENLGRQVAIKFLSVLHVGDDAAEHRFLREARTASALDHPNICVVHEIDRDDSGALYIVMNFYPGGSLADKLARGPLPPQDALRYADEIASGLEAAHEVGILHRDIKPANIMLAADDTARIIDFGIAKLTGGAVLTRSGAALGTVSYMSPEQVRGEELDGRTDLYSLGCVLFEMLTGQAPFCNGNIAQILHDILFADVPSLAEILADQPSGLTVILNRLLAKHRQDRYWGPAELRQDLAGAMISDDRTAVPLVPIHATVKKFDEQSVQQLHSVGPRLAGRSRLLQWLGFTLLFVAAGLWMGKRLGNDRVDLNLSSRRILIGDFVNTSGDPVLDNLAPTIAGELAQGIRELENLEVESRTGVSPGPEDVTVQGDYSAFVDSLRLRIRVVDADGNRLFSLPTFNSSVSQSSRMLKAARDRVVGGLAAVFGSVFNEPISRAPTYDAALAYVTAQKIYFDRPRKLLDRAFGADSTFVLPLLLLARDALVENDGRARLFLGLIEDRRYMLSTYEQHRLDLHLAEGDYKYEEALRQARLAESLAPDDYLVAYLISDMLFKLGRPTEMLEHHRHLVLRPRQLSHEGYARMLRREIDAFHLLRDFKSELQATERALTLFPADNKLLGKRLRALAALGRIEELFQEAEMVFARPEESGDPTYTLLPALLTLRAEGRRDTSVELANLIHDWLENLSGRQARKYSNQADDWFTLYLAERWPEASAALSKLKMAYPDTWGQVAYLAWDGLMAARLGERERALTILNRLHERDKKSRPGYRDYRECAEIAALLGLEERATGYLQQAFAAGLAHDVFLHESPELECLRDNPTYRRLMAVK